MSARIRGLAVELPKAYPITGWDNGAADILGEAFTADELAALAVAAAGGRKVAIGMGDVIAQAVMAAPTGGPWSRLSNILAVAAHRAAGRVAEDAAPAT